MLEQGRKEKERRDKQAREEDLAVGMKVLLKNKVKRKGQPKYDPKPYVITDLRGRQATLERGEKKIRRETQKFKRFFEPTSPEEGTATTMSPREEWEESWRRADANEQEQGADRDVLAATDLNRPQPEDNHADHNPVPAANDDTQDGEPDVQLTRDNQQQATEGRRTSNRDRRARDMYGDWDTSGCRKYNRR